MLLASLALMAASAISPKASLEVRVIGGPRPVDVVLRRTDAGDPVDVAVLRLPAGAAAVSFRDLDAGTYMVIAAGADPLARRATRARLENGDRQRVTIRVEPRRVEGTVIRAGKPLPNVTLRFRNDDLGWSASLKADAGGRFSSELWQPGSYAIGIGNGGLHNTYPSHETVAGGPLTLTIPLRQIRGRVIDVASGRGVPDAQVTLRTQKETSATTVRERSDADGAFVFDAVPAGRQQVSVVADDYLIPDPVELTVGDDDAAAEIRVDLDSGFPRQLRVFDYHGQPVRGAEVVVASGNRLRSTSHTAADGRAVVAVPAEPVTLYALAPAGGFAIVDRREVERVDLPAPRSSLRMITHSATGAVLPPISFVMAVDGRIIPPAVARQMGPLHGFSLRTDSAGEVKLRNIPAGEYQFWPYDGEAELATIMAAPYEAPITVTVKSGENVVAVDFRPTSLSGVLQHQ